MQVSQYESHSVMIIILGLFSFNLVLPNIFLLYMQNLVLSLSLSLSLSIFASQSYKDQSLFLLCQHLNKTPYASLCVLIKSLYFWVRLMSTESYHWTRWIADTCPLLDTCPNPDVFSDNFHLTQALPYIFCISLQYINYVRDPSFKFDYAIT